MPVGVPAPGGTGVTVAVKVTPCPKVDGFSDDVTAVVVFALIVNDQLEVAGNAFPDMSVTPPVPPVTLAVYATPPANAVLGVYVAMRVAVA